MKLNNLADGANLANFQIFTYTVWEFKDLGDKLPIKSKQKERLLQAQYIPEIEIIVAVVKWLHASGWTIEHISIPHGQGIDSISSKANLQMELALLGIQDGTVKFVSKGEDIRAKQGNTLWRIECKGLGTDLPSSTVRNNFDRALASTVSYYNRSEGLRLGIALPEEYFRFVKSRLPMALRIALNMWVLLYVRSDSEIYELTPNQELPT